MGHRHRGATYGLECAFAIIGEPAPVRSLVYEAAQDFPRFHDLDVAALPDGGAVVVWSADTGGGTGHDIWLQLMSAAGETSGAAVQANGLTGGGQFVPRVAALGEHGFVVVRETDGGQDGSGYGVYGRRFTLGGQALTDDFLVNVETHLDQRSPAVAGSSDGHFVVSYATVESGSGHQDVHVRRFDGAGATRANLFWTSPAQATPYDQCNEVYGQRFDRSGARRYR